MSSRTIVVIEGYEDGVQYVFNLDQDEMYELDTALDAYNRHLDQFYNNEQEQHPYFPDYLERNGVQQAPFRRIYLEGIGEL